MRDLVKPLGIVIHHSLTKDGNTCDWDAIKKYHMTAPEYMMEDIGYHAGVERINGVITTLQGRPVNKEGGHTKGKNNMLGLCIVGNFDSVPPDKELLNAAVELVRGWLRMFPHLTTKDVHMHREFADYKSCPGWKFPWWEFLNLI